MSLLSYIRSYNQLHIMDITDRVKLIMDEESLTSTEFAEKTGIQQSTFSHFINGRNKASLDVITKIHEAFLDINIEWLLYGRGDMHRNLRTDGSKDPDLFSTTNPMNNIDKLPMDTTTGLSIDSLSALAPLLAKHAELEAQIQEAKKPRKITEIRVFFDDNSYEIFKAER